MRACPYCFEPVQSMPPDGVDCCRVHGVVEGNVVTIPDDAVRVLPCGCRYTYDGLGGYTVEQCDFHAAGDAEPPRSDGPPYTDAVDDEDGMSEIRNELAQNPFDTPSEWEQDHR